ncbi:MAG TPA: YraN family protein [Acidimicrobiales bacterium]|nr:YraN family protein [Acidimicrobiales bacterium]
MSIDPRRALGASGEEAAAAVYLDRGWTVEARNWRCRDGELDLVLSGDGILAFCEVKTRTSDRYGSPAAAVTPSKQARIRRLAVRWLGETGQRASRLRFDVAVVRGDEVQIIEGAF